MKIDIICNDGSPMGVTWGDMYGKHNRIGVGGAELALLSMCEYWADAGYQVRLYNNPRSEVEKFEQLQTSQFSEMEDRDILIIFRSPNLMAIRAKGKKIWWSTDQYTVGNFQSFGQQVPEKIVLISPFHQQYFKETYGLENTIVIDLPVRIADYQKEVERIPNKILFSSIPDRGLGWMREVWDRVKVEIPDVSLSITSDYRLWGVSGARNEQYRIKFIQEENVKFHGALPREAFIDEQLSSDLMVYPCIYDELFCIACAEAQVAGAYPITTETGALSTTNMGEIIYGPDLVRQKNQIIREMSDRVIELLDNPDVLERVRTENMRKAVERFSPERILKQWDEEVFE